MYNYLNINIIILKKINFIIDKFNEAVFMKKIYCNEIILL